MLNSRIPAMRNQALIGLSLLVAGLYLAWQLGGAIVGGNSQFLIFAALGFVACAVIVAILRSWRSGFYFFLIWLMFEDLVRKYMGNNLALFFGKDILLAFVYIAFYVKVRRGQEKTFRPPFMFFLSLFMWLAVLQVFNPNSPSIWYGLLGLKVYFYYVPLMFIGYALIHNDDDLRKFLARNALLAGVVSVLGIIQAIVGNSFLNPKILAPELADLGDLTKSTPISGQVFSLPPSVFVSSGRYADYLIVAFILAVGAAAYLLLYTRQNRKLILSVVGLIAVATLLSGSRTALVGVVASAIVLSVAYVWAAPWRQRQGDRVVKAIRRSAIAATLALVALVFLFPKQAAPRIAFFSETLSPNSATYEGSARGWSYPIGELEKVFEETYWVWGKGTGTASLGGQYVARLTGVRAFTAPEEGYAQMITEMGILAPSLWIVWVTSLIYSSWKVARRLRGTRFFPIAMAAVWYAFFLLGPQTYITIAHYQNYICNAYLWLLIGVLFRLPSLLAGPSLPPTAAPALTTSSPHE